MTVAATRWKVIQVPTRGDARGTLAFIEHDATLPFVARRVFYVYGLGEGASRGGHAHRETQQCLVCLTGSMDVELDDGTRRETIALSAPDQAVYIPPMTWTELRHMAKGTTFFVLADTAYDEADYYRDRGAFLAAVAARGAKAAAR